MPRIRMITLAAGPSGARHPNTLHEVSLEEGTALVDGHAAVWIDQPSAPVGAAPAEAPSPDVERAVTAPAERAVGAPQRPPRRGGARG